MSLLCRHSESFPTSDASTFPADRSPKLPAWKDAYKVLVVGDLHLEDDMTLHRQARDDCVRALRDLPLAPDDGLGERLTSLQSKPAGDLSVGDLELLLQYRKEGDLMNCAMVSLGDLGRKDIRHEPGDAGTTKSFQDAKEFMDRFGVYYDLVTGNHDLEGLDEFDTDADNLQAWLDCFGKTTPHFYRRVAEKTLLLGFSTIKFREAPFSSHEVIIDDEQMNWLAQTIEAHPASEGWTILIFSHAPIMGSGLRVLQNVHVTNGCAWLNHSSETKRKRFISLVRANPQIKLWFSGHFHLSHDYQDAISTVGSCTFVQTGVMGAASTRDGRRQTRLVHGSAKRLQIYSINHHIRTEDDQAEVRLDAEIDLHSGAVRRVQDETQAVDREDWFQAYTPRPEDGCYLETADGLVADAFSIDSKVCWWHMKDDKVIGLHEGQLVEYDAETLSPLGIVVNKETLGDREVLLVQNGTALVLADKVSGDVEVVHPNEDGSYWRKFQRNKRVRLEEKAREEIAMMWLKEKGLSSST